MAKGRKSLPSKIHQLHGNPGRRPPNADEPMPPESMPECPEHLDEIAKAEWKRAGKLLMDVRIMTDLDMAMLAGYVTYFSQWCTATVQLQKSGMVYKRKDGAPGWNPYFRVANDCYDRMVKTAVLLGLSPSSRVNLKVEKKKEADPAAEFLKKLNG